MTGKHGIVIGVVMVVIIGCILIMLVGGMGLLLYSRQSSTEASSGQELPPPSRPILTEAPEETMTEVDTTPSLHGRIVFQTNRESVTDDINEIYVMNADGSKQINLTNHPANDIEPAWSPDGTRIAFASDRDGNTEIYVMNADGSNPVNLTNHSAQDAYPIWSPDGSKIFFQSNRDWLAVDTPLQNKLLNIYVMNTDGSEPTRLTPFQAEKIDNYFQASASPNGQHLIFFCQTELKNKQLCVMNIDGTELHSLTTDDYFTPAWSPDGANVVASDRMAHLVIMNADGSGLVELTRNDMGTLSLKGNDPVWSPDGTHLLFGSNQFEDDGSFEIYRATINGSDISRLTDTPYGGDSKSPSWTQ